jgi:polyisoprenoid-binding protein YceI
VIDRVRRLHGIACILTVAVTVPSGALLGEGPGNWSVSDADVRVACPLTVGGSFDARTTAITGTLAPAANHALSGELSVDLTKLDTGISLRNTHMREKYLEVGKGDDYARAVLSEITLADGDPATFDGKTHFKGTLLLHGQRKPISGEARLERRGSNVAVEASFPVVLQDFGIEKPRYLGVGVRDEVQVHVRFTAAPGRTGSESR